MKNTFWFIQSILIIFLLVLTSNVQAEVSTNTNYNIVTFKNNSLKLHELERLVSGLNLEEIQLEYNTGEDVFTFGYLLGDKQSLSDAVEKLKNNIINELKSSKLDLIHVNSDDIIRAVNDETLIVKKLISSEDIMKLKDTFSKKSAYIETINENKQKMNSKDENLLLSLTKDQSTPYGGSFELISNSNGKFIVQNFEFSSWGLEYYNNEPNRKSFELDTVFYNYDGNAWAVDYAGTSGTYWSTNLPYPYLDTDFGDDISFYGGGENEYGEPDETTFSVGTSYAQNLEPNYEYYYTIEVEGTSRSGTGGKVKLTGQPGTVLVPGIGSWGVFADETYFLEPFTNFSQNVVYNWTR